MVWRRQREVIASLLANKDPRFVVCSVSNPQLLAAATSQSIGKAVALSISLYFSFVKNEVAAVVIVVRSTVQVKV